MFEVTLNPALQKFDDFATEAMNAPVMSQKSEISRLEVNRKTGEVRVVKATNDSCFRISRPKPEQISNNMTRMGFFNAVAAQFGGVHKIPQSVREAMKQEGFGDVSFEENAANDATKFNTGKPLRAYRIQQVLKAVKKEVSVRMDSVKNLVKNLLRINEPGMEESIKADLEDLFDAALPPKWNRSRHFQFATLQTIFNATEIKDLRNKIMNEVIPDILGLAKSGKAGDAANRIAMRIEQLEMLFKNDDKPNCAKERHVHQIADLFKGGWLSLVEQDELNAGTSTLATAGDLHYDLTEKTLVDFARVDGTALARQLGTTGDLMSVKSGILERLESYRAPGNETAVQGLMVRIANIGLALSGGEPLHEVAGELKDALQAMQKDDALDVLGDRKDEFVNLLDGVCSELEEIKTKSETAYDEYVKGAEDEANKPQEESAEEVKEERLIPQEEEAVGLDEGEEEINTKTNRSDAASRKEVEPFQAEELAAARTSGKNSGEETFQLIYDVMRHGKSEKMKSSLRAGLKTLAENLMVDNPGDSRKAQFVADLQDAFSNVTEYPSALKLMRQYCDGIADEKQKFLCRMKIDAFKTAFDGLLDSKVSAQKITLDDYVEMLGREYVAMERTPEAIVQFLTEKLSKIFPDFAYDAGELRDVLPEVAKGILAGGTERDQMLAEFQSKFEARMNVENVGTTFDRKASRKLFAGICEILRTGMSPAQRAFITAEIKEYREWYNQYLATHGNKMPEVGQVAKWKFGKAINKDYQEKVFRLFGSLLRPVTVDNAAPASDDPCPKADIPALGHGQKESLPGLTKDMAGVGGFQIAADATWFGGTWNNGQEEGLLVDLPAFSIALLARQGYIEPFQSDKLTRVEDGDAKKVSYWRYTVDENGERKLKSWLGFALPSFTFSSAGKPIDGDDVKLNWYVFTAASGFGSGKVNIDRGGFLEALRHRPDSPLRTDEDRKQANDFFSKIDDVSNRVTGDYAFLYEREAVGFGLDKEQKQGLNGRKWNEMMFLAHFYVGPEFNVFGADAKKEFEGLVNLVRGGQYQEQMKKAIANYEKTLAYQTDLWARLFRKLKVDYVVCTTPGGTNFANPKGTMINRLTRSIARLGGNVQYYLHNFDSRSPVARYSEAFKSAKKAIMSKVKGRLRRWFGDKSQRPAAV